MIDNYLSFKSIYVPVARDSPEKKTEDKKEDFKEKENEKPKEKSPDKNREDFGWEDWENNDPFMKMKNPSKNPSNYWENEPKKLAAVKRSHARTSSLPSSPVSRPRQPVMNKVEEPVLQPHPASTPASGDLLYFEPTPQPEP